MFAVKGNRSKHGVEGSARVNPGFSSAETVQELQRALLRELRAQRAAAALVHPAGDGVHLLLLSAAAAVRVHAHMKAAARLLHGVDA